VKLEEPPIPVVPFEYTSPWMTTEVEPCSVSELPGLFPQPPWLRVSRAGVEFWLPTNDVTSPKSTVAVVRVDYVNGIDAGAGVLPSLRTMNQTLSLQTTPGWDDVTGFGSPNANFISALSH
jgi:hypothetical protein